MPHVMQASHRVTIETDSNRTLSFKEKVRRHFAKGHPKDDRAKHLTRTMFVFQAITQLYVSLKYLVPYIFEDFDPWTQYYIKVGICYLCINAVANWLCVMLYDTSFQRTKDRPEYNVEAVCENNPDHFVGRIENHYKNGSLSSSSETDEWSSGGYCVTCQMNIPPRAHHCDYCKKCILKRDHHCFMVGTCIGFKNQRYFIVLAFYSTIIGLLGGYFTGKYLYDVFVPKSCLSDFVLPVTFYRMVFGDIDLLTFLLIYHSYLLVPMGCIASIYFVSQMIIVSQGLTIYEIAKKVDIKCTRPVNENFRSVFGDFWGLNFLFPAQIIFRQREDGKSWDGIKIIKRTKVAKS
ncbi:uncharacterized protein [Haliotis asinina]|uniref:uncharacterized protein n=1 Tax=Haliotis asinina TaxID=109174 RepID=UPI00353262A9